MNNKDETSFMKKINEAAKKLWTSLTNFIKKTGRSVKKTTQALFARFKKKDHNAFMSDNKSDNLEHTQEFDVQELSQKRNKKVASRKPDSKTRELPHISKEHLSGEGKEHVDMFKPTRRNKSFAIGIVLTSVKLIVLVIFMISAAGLGSLVGIAKAYMETTPMLDTAEIEEQSQTSYIYDSEGNRITAYTGAENREWASIDEIPDMLQKAVIAVEDVRFDYHSGVDIKRIVGVFIDNLMNDNVQGGSTITQQLIKNSILSTERTYKRKIQEAYLAMQLEQEYEKPQILESYLNTINLGASNYGVKAAALDYFNKDLSDLTLRECAMLGGITQYPYLYNPRRCYYTADKPYIINDRTDHVLEQMYIAGFITKEEYDTALKDEVDVEVESKVKEMYSYPYFIEYAIQDITTHLLDKRNLQNTKENRNAIDNELRTGGYEIHLTIDQRIQQIVQDSLEEWDDYPDLEDPDDSVVVNENSDGSVDEVIQPQAAAVVLEQTSGELKAIVGGRETPEAKRTLNRAYQTSMPVGSSIKPLAVYAPAIDLGFSDGAVVPNLPLAIEGWDTEKGFPSGGSPSYGPVTLRQAVVRSLNSATAYTLMNLVGLDESYNYLIRMGINPLHIKKTGSGLALGTSGITPIEMAAAYATIANSGTYKEALSFTQVIDSADNVILDADDIREEHEVFDPATAWLMTDILQDAVMTSEGTGRKAQIKDMHVGGKTGTNQNAKGVFFSGITPYYTATIWIGHDNFRPLKSNVYASHYAAPLWQYFMSQVLEGMPDREIIETTYEELGLVRVRICPVSGQRATEACDASDHKPVYAYYRQGEQPTQECTVHQMHSVCLESGKIINNCPDELIENKSLVFLDSESIYWKLTKAQLDEYLPWAFPALEDGLLLTDLTPDMDIYDTYFCDIHTDDWAAQQAAMAEAVTAANAQITTSQGVLSNAVYQMSMEDRQKLNNKVEALQSLMVSEGVTPEAITQMTQELISLTDMLVELYTPKTEPEPEPSP